MERIIERYLKPRDKIGGNINDRNDWLRGQINSRHTVDPMMRRFRVNIETMGIVKTLPGLNER